jgi:sugar lactone lactonase YvrE
MTPLFVRPDPSVRGSRVAARPPRRRLVRLALSRLLVVLAVGVSLGAAPAFWQTATQADFLRGDVDQLSLDEHGRLTLGPELTRVFDPSSSVVWTMVSAKDGTTFLGTGHDGKVFVVSPKGEGSVLFDSPELEVHALAVAPDGGLFVGTSPDGRIYKVDAGGAANPVFDPDDKYIWALAVDAAGTLFAATGDKGTVYRIGADGKGEVFFSTKATHAMTLTFDSTGRLLVGTGSPGRVFRVEAAGKGFLLLDTPFQEVRAIRIAGASGRVYAAAQNGRAPSPGGDAPDTTAPPPSTPPPTPTVSAEIMSFTIIDVPVAAQAPSAAAPREPRGGAAGAVFRIQPDGLWDALWESRDDVPYDLAVEQDGGVLVATGTKGKVYRLTGDPVRPVLVTRVPAQQATLMLRSGDRTYLTTANPGLLVSVSNGRASRGSYESDVKDARLAASWGMLSWRASMPEGTSVQLFTRSGNTQAPDDTWSDWAGPYKSPSGSPIASPKARYLQWRALLSGGASTPVLTSVSAAYLQQNVRPEVVSVTVHPPGVVFQKPFPTGDAEIAGFDGEPPDRRLASQGGPGGSGGGPGLGRRVYQKGLQTFVWKAEDENGDDLSYEVLYRREGETSWRPLKRGLLDTLTVWDTSSVPNGTYVVKIVASDAAAHPPDRALRGELESTSFDIDNTAPAVTVGAVRRDGTRLVAVAEVRDTDSPLTRVEYSLDGQTWRAAFPLDGILDGREETFEMRLDDDAIGRTLVVRAADTLNNLGAGHVVVTGGK